MTGPLGVHLRRGAREGSGREGFRRQDRLRRAEREDRRLRRSRVQAVRDSRDQRRAGRHRRPGVSLHADRQSALLRLGVDVRHPGRGDAEGRRRGARQGRARRGPAVAQRHGRRPQAGVARDRHRRDPRRPHARRRAAADGRRQSQRQDARHQRRQQRQVPRGARPRRAQRQGRRLPLSPAAGVQRRCCRRTRAWPRTSRSVRAPFAAKLDEKLATTEGLLYRRGNFNGTFDQLILRRAAGREERADRVLARLPLGHVAASGPGDHDGPSDGPDGDHLSVRHRQRT